MNASTSKEIPLCVSAITFVSFEPPILNLNMVRSQRNRRRPRRRRRNGKSSITKSPDNSTASFSITKVFSFSASSAIQEQLIDAVSFPASSRLYELFIPWQYYKYTRIKVSVLPTADTTTAANQYAIGYSPFSEGTSYYTTFAQVIQLMSSTIHSATKTVNSSFNVNLQAINSSTQKMFPTSTASTTNDEYQGVLMVCPLSSATTSITVRVEGTVKFFVAQPAMSEDLVVHPQSGKSRFSSSDEALFQRLLARRSIKQ